MIEFINTDIAWVGIAYIIGSVVTWVLVRNALRYSVVERTIDALCTDGFLRYKQGDAGEIEIMKWNSNDD